MAIFDLMSEPAWFQREVRAVRRRQREHHRARRAAERFRLKGLAQRMAAVALQSKAVARLLIRKGICTRGGLLEKATPPSQPAGRAKHVGERERLALQDSRRGLFGFLWDILETLAEGSLDGDRRWAADLDRIRRSQARMNQKLCSLRIRRAKDLADDLGELALYNRALVSVLLDKGVFTRKELAAEMAKVDASDGKVDGQFTGALREDERKR